MENLIKQLIDQGYLKTPAIIRAFQKINRADFMVESAKDKAGANEPFSIGYGQTISQPSTIAFMMELLQPKAGDEILDIGSGSGYTTALFSEIVGETGNVYAVEIIDELKQFGEENVKKYDYIEKGIAKFFCADGSKGLKKYAPFNIIHVAAAAFKVPQALKEQLKIGGRLIIPVGDYTQDLILITRISNKEFREKKYPGFTFVPLVSR